MKKINFNLLLDPTDQDLCAPITKCFVNDKAYDFLIDTGAATTSIVNDEHTGQLHAFDSLKYYGVIGEGHDELILVDSFRVGEIEMKSFVMARCSNVSHPKFNLLGMDFFKNYKCSFLFKEKIILIDNDSLCTSYGNSLFLDKTFHPYIKVKIGSSIYNGIWDTGADTTLFDLKLIKRHKQFERSGKTIGTDSSGRTTHSSVFCLKSAQCSGHHFYDTKVVGIDLSSLNKRVSFKIDFILGYNFISKCNWTFDFPNRRWSIV